MKDELLFYNAYEEFYKMASTSEVFRDFCIDAYGADFSQDGFSDVKQIEMIIPFIKKNGARILDIGCGNGKMIKYLGRKTGAHIYGFDYSDNAIMQAKKNNNSDDFCVGVKGEIEWKEIDFSLDQIEKKCLNECVCQSIRLEQQREQWVPPTSF